MSNIGNGILVVNKPKGATSARVVGQIKRITRAQKAGHTGTLDPLATGVLVCCLNRATKLARFFLHGDKTYHATLGLGIETDTQDATGKVIARKAVPQLSIDSITATLNRFVGQIEQKPPVYSALKHRGQPLYKLARQGQPVQKPARQVDIKNIELIRLADHDVYFRVTCSSGTYVRTLCADIGRALDCAGYLKALCRTENAGFSICDALSIEEIDMLAQKGRLAEKIVPMAEAIPFMPAYRADKVLTEKIYYGRILEGTDIKDAALLDYTGFIKVTDTHNRLLAIIRRKAASSAFEYGCVFPRNNSDANTAAPH
jgi:tRNA pseudouridine55 synthase